MEVLSGRVLLHPLDVERSQRFYRDVLGLGVFREFGPPEHRGVVFFLGGGFLEVSGVGRKGVSDANLDLWLQVRDVRAEYDRLRNLGVEVLREPRVEPWGLVEAWIADPDGVRLVLVQVPEDHPLRKDQRG